LQITRTAGDTFRAAQAHCDKPLFVQPNAVQNQVSKTQPEFPFFGSEQLDSIVALLFSWNRISRLNCPGPRQVWSKVLTFPKTTSEPGFSAPYSILQTQLRLFPPLLTCSLSTLLGHPAGAVRASMRRSMLPNKRCVRWLSASKRLAGACFPSRPPVFNDLCCKLAATSSRFAQENHRQPGNYWLINTCGEMLSNLKLTVGDNSPGTATVARSVRRRLDRLNSPRSSQQRGASADVGGCNPVQIEG
jgi:hypothetical protein